MGFIRRHPVLLVLALLGLTGAVLVVLALPLRSVPSGAAAAKDELTRAVEALKTGDTDVAYAHVATARGHVDGVTETTEGFGAQVWSWVPVAGSAVRDVRNLAGAMDELTAALESTESVYPKISGDDAALMVDGGVDLAVLDELLAALEVVNTHLVTARTHLEEVEGTAPVVGDTAAQARDEAMEQVKPAADGLEQLTPMLGQLPELLGADEKKQYLVAMMNPSEMKFSGGSLLTFAELRVDGGDIARSKTFDVETTPRLFRRGFWENVEGNPFASQWSELITHTSIAPSWPVAGRETLNAWEWLRKKEMDGLIAIDVVAISRMMEVTGPVYVEGMGQVRADNVVEKTAGDYMRFTPQQQAERKALNRALIPAFLDQLFSGNDFVGTIQAFGDAAAGRHLALYFTDETTQQAALDFGFAGDLSDTDHDYVGFFTQNLVGSKADYWQQKRIVSKVTLNEDGSARVRLTATMANEGPVNPNPAGGELSAYTDPEINARFGLFLPRGVTQAKVQVVETSGERSGSGELGDYFGRPYLVEDLVVQPGQEATLKVTYDVPAAAVISGTGNDARLLYRLDLDPHPTVTDARVDVSVSWPEGWGTTRVPEGWKLTAKGALRWASPAMDTVTALEVEANRR